MFQQIILNMPYALALIPSIFLILPRLVAFRGYKNSEVR